MEGYDKFINCIICNGRDRTGTLNLKVNKFAIASNTHILRVVVGHTS